MTVKATIHDKVDFYDIRLTQDDLFLSNVLADRYEIGTDANGRIMISLRMKKSIGEINRLLGYTYVGCMKVDEVEVCKSNMLSMYHKK